MWHSYWLPLTGSLSGEVAFILISSYRESLWRGDIRIDYLLQGVSLERWHSYWLSLTGSLSGEVAFILITSYRESLWRGGIHIDYLLQGVSLERWHSYWLPLTGSLSWEVAFILIISYRESLLRGGIHIDYLLQGVSLERWHSYWLPLRGVSLWRGGIHIDYLLQGVSLERWHSYWSPLSGVSLERWHLRQVLLYSWFFFFPSSFLEWSQPHLLDGFGFSYALWLLKIIYMYCPLSVKHFKLGGCVDGRLLTRIRASSLVCFHNHPGRMARWNTYWRHGNINIVFNQQNNISINIYLTNGPAQHEHSVKTPVRLATVVSTGYQDAASGPPHGTKKELVWCQGPVCCQGNRALYVVKAIGSCLLSG